MQPLFHPFDPHAPVHIYRRNLPHWRQDGCTYFVTFRLADSIPKPVIERWIDEDLTWFKAHGMDGPLNHPEHLQQYDLLPEETRRKFERHRAHRLHVELDACHGACHLTNTAARAIVNSAMVFFHGKRLHSGDLVIMPNHVHWLTCPFPGFELEDLLQSIKRFSSTRLGRELALAGRVWQAENYDRVVRNRGELSAFRRYIEHNPRKVNLRSGSFTYHRATWLDDRSRPSAHPQ